MRTRAGLRTYAIGGDERAAQLNGVPAARMVVALCAINGALVGVASVLLASRLGSVSPDIGLNFEFDVLTAAVLGGVAFTGGAGRPLGVFVGVATIGILNAGLIFEGLQDYWQQVAKGGILLLALAADQVVLKVREAGGWRAWAADQRRRLFGGAGPRRALVHADVERRAAERLATLRRGEGSFGPVVLEADGLTRHYGAVTALAEASLRVRAGEIVRLLGDNGAGKSTLIKLLSGAVVPDSGTIAVRRRGGADDVTARRAQRRDRDRVPGPRALSAAERRAQLHPRRRADEAPAGRAAGA